MKVKFIITGDDRERFLYKLIKHRFEPKEVETSDESITGLIEKRSYFAAARLTGGYAVKLRHKSVRRVFKVRAGLLLGGIAGAGIIAGFGGVILDTAVIGAPEYKDDILHAVRGAEWHGTRINRKNMETAILYHVKQLAWVNADVNGSRLNIRASAVIPEEEKPDPNIPGNIVAAKSGRIIESNVLAGKEAGYEYTDAATGLRMFRGVIEKGSGVSAGQLLVSGITPVKNKEGTVTGAVYKRAEARIIAECEETREFYLPFVSERTVRTGEKVSRDYIEFMGLNLPGFTNEKPKIPDNAYGSSEMRTSSLFGFPLPWKINRTAYEFSEKRLFVMSADDIMRELGKTIENYKSSILINPKLETSVKNVFVKYIPRENTDGKTEGITASVKFRYTENIAKSTDIVTVVNPS